MGGIFEADFASDTDPEWAVTGCVAKGYASSPGREGIHAKVRIMIQSDRDLDRNRDRRARTKKIPRPLG
jgi:hypothetical protein